MNNKYKVGFIGLGIMGKPMAANILKANFPLSVYNRTKEKMENMASSGAYACKNYEEIADRSNAIITMLPDSPEVKEVILGENCLYPYLKSGTIIIF